MWESMMNYKTVEKILLWVICCLERFVSLAVHTVATLLENYAIIH